MGSLSDDLKAIVESVSKRLEQLSDGDAAVRPDSGGWTKKEIVGHLIDSAANNHQRFIRALQAEELVFPAYEQEAWVRLQAYNKASWPQLISLWGAYNLHLAHVFGTIPANKMETPCRIGTNEPVTLGFLVEDYVGHLKMHLKQLGL